MPRHRRGWGMGGGSNCEAYHSPLSVSMLEPVLLALIKERPSHGYTLLNDLSTLGLGMLHQSVVYRVLREMEDLEWIQSDWSTDQTQGPPRRVYRLTVHGEAALANWRGELEKIQAIIASLLSKM